MKVDMFYVVIKSDPLSWYLWPTVRRCSPVCLPVDGAPWFSPAAFCLPRCSPAPSATGIPSAEATQRKICDFSNGITAEVEKPNRAYSERQNSPDESRLNQNWPSSLLWSTRARRRCTSPWLIHKQVETRSSPPHLREKEREREQWNQTNP